MLRRLWIRILIFLGVRKEPHVPEHGWQYFDHMVAVYLTLNVDDSRAAKVIQKAEERPYGITWSDVFLLENIILAMQPDDTVVRNAWLQRERFREIAGPDMYQRYVESGVPTATDTQDKVKLLRADLSRIMDFLHWYYEMIPIREKRRKQLTEQCILFVALYTLVLIALLRYFHKGEHGFLAMIACVIFFGIIGGFVSSQRRMQNIPADGDPLISIFGLENAQYYLWLSPLLGSIFAVVLTLMFMGGVLKGTVFPAFHDFELPNSGYMLARLAMPEAAKDYAMLYIWCFMAGFAERLVPDSLDRLAAKLDPNNQPPPSTAPKPSPEPPPGGGLNAIPPEAPKRLQEETLDSALHSSDKREA